MLIKLRNTKPNILWIHVLKKSNLFVKEHLTEKIYNDRLFIIKNAYVLEK